MIDDVVEQLGYLTLGTRLKRIGERLQTDAQRIFEAHELMIPAGQWPFLAAIDRLGPLAVSELARAVGVTQPGATRTVAQLVSDGWVAVSSSQEDQRRKRVSLTPQGKRVVSAGKQLAFPVIEGAVRELCRDLRGPLLDQLGAMEQGLRARPLHLRTGGKPARRK